MLLISATFNPAISTPKCKSTWELARGYEGIIDSRESTYRTFLDLTGYCFPMTLAAATRNIWNFLETGFETVYDAVAVFSAPYQKRSLIYSCLSSIFFRSGN